MQNRPPALICLLGLLIATCGQAFETKAPKTALPFRKLNSCAVYLQTALASARRNLGWRLDRTFFGALSDSRIATAYFGIDYSLPEQPLSEEEINHWVFQDLFALGYRGTLETDAISDFLDSILESRENVLTSDSLITVSRLFDHPTALIKNPVQRIYNVIDHPSISRTILVRIIPTLADSRISLEEMKSVVERVLTHPLAREIVWEETLEPRIEFFKPFASVVVIRPEFAPEFYSKFIEIGSEPQLALDQVRGLADALGNLARYQFGQPAQFRANERQLIRSVDLLDLRANDFWNARGSREFADYRRIIFHTQRLRLLVGTR